ncbi:MAG: ABC transporter substrate-binding protein [Clostridium sp.]
MRKRLLACVIAGTLAMSILAGCSKEDDKTIQIGGIGPLSGPATTYGQSVKEGADLYVEEINNAGGVLGKQVELSFEDDQADPNVSIQAFNKLVDNDKVVAILGPVTSGAANAVAPNATTKEIPLITPTGTEPNITKNGGEFTFRGCFVDSFQGEILAKYTKENLGKKSAAVLYNAGSDYSKGIAESFKKDFEAKGGQVLEYLSYNDKESDYNAQLTKIKAANPDVLVLPDYYNVVGSIAKQARDKGITAQLLGGDGWESEELATTGKDAVNGALYINHYYSADKDESVKKFVDSYKAKYSKEPDAFAALAYDSMKVLLKGIEDAGSTDGVAVKDALKKVELTSVTGNIKFNSDRSAIKSASIIKVNGDKKELVDKVNP